VWAWAPLSHSHSANRPTNNSDFHFCFENIYLHPCPGGEIGRHTILRGWRLQGHTSSNLVPGTKKPRFSGAFLFNFMVLKPSKSILAITFCWLCLTMAAQNSWQAKVINKETELPIEAATLIIENTSVVAYSDTLGLVHFDTIPTTTQNAIISTLG